MNASFVTIKGRSRGYYLGIGALVALTLVGFVSFGIAYVKGHQVFGSSNVVPWGMSIVLTIYLIGLSAGSLILSSLTYVLGREEYRPISRMAVFLAIVLIFGAMIAIATDLGRPEKFWRLFMFFYLNNMTSMFSINGLLYGGYFAISLLYLGLILADQPRLTRIVGVIAVAWAALVHMGTGAIFGFIAAREAWFSPLRPFEFLAAALTSGLALLIVVLVVTFWLTGRQVGREMLVPLGRLLAALIVALMLLIFVDKLTHLYEPARGATVFTLTGQYSWIFWGLQVSMVALIPLAVLLYPRTARTVQGVFVAAASVVIGVLAERYYLVMPGAAYPQPYYPGKIEGVYGAVGRLSLPPAEIGLSLGIFAFLGLLYLLGLKYLELLPSREGGEQPPASLKG